MIVHIPGCYNINPVTLYFSNNIANDTVYLSCLYKYKNYINLILPLPSGSSSINDTSNLIVSLLLLTS